MLRKDLRDWRINHADRERRILKADILRGRRGKRTAAEAESPECHFVDENGGQKKLLLDHDIHSGLVRPIPLQFSDEATAAAG
jgi:hypothetical protein